MGVGGHPINDAGFAAFVREHSRSLFGTACLLTGDPHAAEELLQDTLARLYPSWDRVATADAPLAYARRAVVNRFVSGQRRPGAHDLAMWTLPDSPSREDVGEAVANRRMIWQLLGTLPERQRAALVLRYFHDLADAEIAASLGCRAGTVRSLLSRGLASLREAAERVAPSPPAVRGEHR